MSDVETKQLLRVLVEKRKEWSTMARGIECARGDDDPAAKAFRHCIGDLYGIIKEHGENPDE
jgi:hypothetical protein